ncbi:MAG: ABC transporter permease [bacterium]|nr:ABC transporter permease [bacterium]
MNKFKKLAIPYLLWMSLLVLIPLVLMIIMSFLDMQYIEINNAKFTLANFPKAFNKTYISAFLKSMKLSIIATIGCVIIAYPIAYIISKIKFVGKSLLLVIFILPMWTNMLLRIETINKMLDKNGLLQSLTHIRLNMAGTEFAVICVMIIVYLPFMIFPIYTILEKIDNSLIEASADLGATPTKSFMKVTLPLSLKGVSSGVTMVFLPCMMGFTIPQIVSNGKVVLIGNIIEQKFKGSTGQYNIGMLISVLIIFIILIAIWIISKLDPEGETLI